jgi:hypothetical protein
MSSTPPGVSCFPSKPPRQKLTHAERRAPPSSTSEYANTATTLCDGTRYHPTIFDQHSNIIEISSNIIELLSNIIRCHRMLSLSYCCCSDRIWMSACVYGLSSCATAVRMLVPSSQGRLMPSPSGADVEECVRLNRSAEHCAAVDQTHARSAMPCSCRLVSDPHPC